ncbi:MAG: guanosine monophosphate reductase [bacterium]|nr:guanosine monophosphate reductase [bacterium]
MINFELALGFEDICLLPNFSEIDSRKNVSTKTILSRNINIDLPIVLSPMDTVSTVESCIKMNYIGAAGILHRFMSIEDQSLKTREIKEKSGKSFSAICLKDSKNRIPELIKNGVDLLFLDSANGLSRNVFEFTKWFYTESGYKSQVDLVVGNTLSKESISRLINIGADSFRHNISPGSACITAIKTGIACPSITANYYAWKAIRNYKLYNNDWGEKTDKLPSILLDGGIRTPSDLCKAIASYCDGIIAGGIFVGCHENTNLEDIVEINGKKMVKYRGMASQEVVEEYDIWDKTDKNLFVEGESFYKPYQDKSVEKVVYEFVNGLRSCMSYLGMSDLDEMKGGLWTGKIRAVRTTANSMYERGAHGKG